VSRVGNKPVTLPKGVSVTVAGGNVSVKGPKGTLSRAVPPLVSISVEGDVANVARNNETSKARAMHGLARALLQNMVTGVTAGFTRKLEINGVGYRAEVRKDLLALTLGYSHPIEITLPSGVTAKVEKQTEVEGVGDRQGTGRSNSLPAFAINCGRRSRTRARASSTPTSIIQPQGRARPRRSRPPGAPFRGRGDVAATQEVESRERRKMPRS
jgi:large subunit ribosomal protein L6